jgi:hypothetical protein
MYREKVGSKGGLLLSQFHKSREFLELASWSCLKQRNVSSNIIKIIKYRRMWWEWNLARVREIRNAYKIFVEKSETKGAICRTRHRWKDNIRVDLKWIDGTMCTGCIWFRIGISGGVLWTLWRNFGFHRRQRISWLAKWLWASQEGLCSMD